MSRFVFCAALVNGQIWAAALMLSTTTFSAGVCAALSATWMLIAGCFLFAPKEPTNDR